MKTTISTEATAYTYGLEGLHEYLWDGKLSREEIEEKADSIMSKVVDLINADGFTWDTTHGVLEYDDDDYETSDDAIEEFLDDKERFIRQVVEEMESSDSREMELASFCREMIALGWTLDSFDEDFDGFESDEVTPDEKATCKKIFAEVWEQVQEEILDKAPDTCILRNSDLSETRINNIILGWGNDADITESQLESMRETIVTYVNNRLPAYMIWFPEASEIMGKKGQTITLEDFNELLDKAFGKFLV